MSIGGTQKGFTLLEVMISIAILAIGMLGIAGLQMVSIEHNNAAYLRSQAVTISQDIVERMRNNPLAVSAGAFDLVNSNTTPVANDECLTSDVGCTTNALALIDKTQWSLMINSLNDDNTKQQLPNAKATVTKHANKENLFTVKVEWEIKKLASVSGSQSTYIRNSTKTNYEFKVVIN